MDFDFSIGGTATLGERGQVVIPAKTRKQMKLKTGEKFVVFCKSGEMIGLMKASQVDRILGKISNKMTGGIENMKKIQAELKKKK